MRLTCLILAGTAVHEIVRAARSLINPWQERFARLRMHIDFDGFRKVEFLAGTTVGLALQYRAINLLSNIVRRDLDRLDFVRFLALQALADIDVHLGVPLFVEFKFPLGLHVLDFSAFLLVCCFLDFFKGTLKALVFLFTGDL